MEEAGKEIVTFFISHLLVSSLVFVRLVCAILIYIQQDATLHSLFYLETALHVSGGTSTHHQERKQLYLQHLVFVTPLLRTATIAYSLSPKTNPAIS